MTASTFADRQPDSGLAAEPAGREPGLLIQALWAQRWRLTGCALLGGALGAAGSFLITPSFTGRTSFLPPHQSQNAAASALGALGALAAAAPGMRTTGDQYMALLQSVSIRDRLVDRFELKKVYDEDLRVDARIELSKNTRLSLGRKDGLLVVEVDDHDPARAAAMANAYVEELQRISSGLVLTEAQQRRAFFESQLEDARKRLADAQQKLDAAGISVAALKAEPKATAEAYARLRAELTSAEIKLRALRSSLAEDTPEVQRQSVTVSSLRGNLQRMENVNQDGDQSGYIAAYRELKYHEALFELVARQYEMARVDESRDGGLLQLVDKAEVPERKSKPKRSIIALLGAALGLLAGGALALRRGRRH